MAAPMDVEGSSSASAADVSTPRPLFREPRVLSVYDRKCVI
jgi:hypothetical protein